MSIVQVIDVCSSPKAKNLSKPEPVQTGTKVCPQGIPVWTGFTVVRAGLSSVQKIYFENVDITWFLVGRVTFKYKIIIIV